MAGAGKALAGVHIHLVRVHHLHAVLLAKGNVHAHHHVKTAVLVIFQGLVLVPQAQIHVLHVQVRAQGIQKKVPLVLYHHPGVELKPFAFLVVPTLRGNVDNKVQVVHELAWQGGVYIKKTLVGLGDVVHGCTQLAFYVLTLELEDAPEAEVREGDLLAGRPGKGRGADVAPAGVQLVFKNQVVPV